MSNDTQRSPRQGGGQRRGRNRQGNNRGNNRGRRNNNTGRNNRGPRKNAAPQKLSLWDKIVLFFSFRGEKPHPRTGPAKTPQAHGPQTRTQNKKGQGQGQGQGQGKRKQRERSNRRVENIEVTNPRLYVGNLSYDATESDLFELFNGVGQVQNAEVVTNRHTQRSKGFAFVEMQTIDEAKRAVEVLHDKDFMDRKLLVSGAKAKTAEDTSSRRRESPKETAEAQEAPTEPTAEAVVGKVEEPASEPAAEKVNEAT